MIAIKPKFRGFVCTTAHPNGCQENVQQQIDYVLQQDKFVGPKKALIIGASTGYGLASRISLTFGCDADTIGVFFERPYTDKRPASAGWYNTAAFEQAAHAAGKRAYSINGDAFSKQIKMETVDLIKREFGQIDCLIYSLAAPKRLHPETGQLYSSVLKPIGASYCSKTVDFHTEEVSEIEIAPANDEEIEGTISVMGGNDWQIWVEMLMQEKLLAEGIQTFAYSYIGPPLTHPIYRDGTVGRAKMDLEKTAQLLNDRLKPLNGQAIVSVNKALVTQASAAIPVVPLYISLLYKVMKDKDIHEGCIEQIYRLFAESVHNCQKYDEAGRLRLDDWELQEDVQQQVNELWSLISNENISQLSDIAGFRREFFQLFGFDFSEIDYEATVDIERDIPSMKNR